MWTKIIKACHDQHVGFFPPYKVEGSGTWKLIVRSINHLHDSCVCGTKMFRDHFHRLFSLLVNRNGYLHSFWSKNGWFLIGVECFVGVPRSSISFINSEFGWNLVF